MNAPFGTTKNRTQAQAVADQIDCDLDNMVRRCLTQSVRDSEAKKHWEKIAVHIESIRSSVRQRMHADDCKVTT